MPSAFQSGDLLGTPIAAVYAFQQLSFGHHRHIDPAFHNARDFIGGIEVGRVSHPDQQHAIAVFQHDRVKLPRQIFRKQPYQFGFDLKVLEIDVNRKRISLSMKEAK